MKVKWSLLTFAQLHRVRPNERFAVLFANEHPWPSLLKRHFHWPRILQITNSCYQVSANHINLFNIPKCSRVKSKTWMKVWLKMQDCQVEASLHSTWPALLGNCKYLKTAMFVKDLRRKTYVGRMYSTCEPFSWEWDCFDWNLKVDPQKVCNRGSQLVNIQDSTIDQTFLHTF